MTERRPLSPDDYWRMRLLTDMRLAPDGARVAYVVETSDREENERRSAIWLLDLETGASRQFTSGTGRDSAPRWSPDGTQLAFISTREDDTPQLYLLRGGEPRRLTHMRRGASEPFWSADGAWVGFHTEVRPGEAPAEPPPSDQRARERLAKDEAERPRLVTRLIYRWDGKGYLEGRMHLFRVSLADGAVEPLTEGDWDDDEGACSPDGRWLAFISDRSERRDANMAADLWLLDLQSRAARRLTDERVLASHPNWSPDGARVAFLAAREVGEHAIYNTTLVVADAETGTLSYPLAGHDLSLDVSAAGDVPKPSLSAPLWSADGASIFALAQRGGGVDVLSISPDGGDPRPAVAAEGAIIGQIALTAGGEQLVALQCTPHHPWDLFAYPLGAGAAAPAPQRLTEVNRALLGERLVAAPERFIFSAFDGQEIEAWLYRPPNHTGVDRPTPLVLSVHGGPHGAYGNAFYLQAQTLTGLGYAVLLANPRGSAGYGEAFMQACDRDWGGGDFRDLMGAVDAALARGGLDAERMAVMGVSYGGYMTNWIVTQTDRFRAAVSIYGIANLVSMFGTADMDAVWAQGDYGWPWERGDFYRERSPLTHVAAVTTPMRIIGAEHDYRCPISQGEEWFTWLKKLGRAPVDFVRLPTASHTTYASPRQRIKRLELALEWITRHCPPDGHARPAPE